MNLIHTKWAFCPKAKSIMVYLNGFMFVLCGNPCALFIHNFIIAVHMVPVAYLECDLCIR